MSAERYSLNEVLAPGKHDLLVSIVHLINSHAVFIYPTETIYGIGGVYHSETVKKRIYEAKQRPPEHALILLGANLSAFDALDLIWPPSAQALAAAFWPGPLTLVLPRRNAEATGLRVSHHPFIVALSRYCNIPIFSTSANKSGIPYSNDSQAIYEQFKTTVDFMVDAGPLPFSLPSTIVKITADDSVSLLREGVITSVLIKNALSHGH